MMENQQSPVIEVNTLPVDQGYIHVVRDDLLPGGTKQRAIIPMLQILYQQGYTEFVYASPFAGFAQIALSVSCQTLGYQCTLFCEQNRDSEAEQPNTLHELSGIARNAGAKIYISPTLVNAESAAAEYSRNKPGCFLFPLGFNCQTFREQLYSILEELWRQLIKKTGKQPTGLWLPVGSGTLASVFRKLLPLSVHLKCVSVNELEKDDTRIQDIVNSHAVSMQYSSRAFIEPVQEHPDIPSSAYYDAKLWSFIKKQAKKGDVWWNVAR